MDSIKLLREQLTEAHALLEAVMQDVTPDAAHWVPPGQANPIGASYAHVAVLEDRTINGIILHRRPLYETTWSGRTGMSELMPLQGKDWDDYTAWTRRLKVDISSVREYAKA